MNPKSLFGTSGIRGDAEKLFTNQFSFDLGRTFALFLRKYQQAQKVAVGMDPRGSSPGIKDSFVSGLLFENFEVFDEGATCVPSINYILKAKSFLGGSAMISGSHIKPHLNGIKFFAFEEEISKQYEAEISDIFSKIKDREVFSRPDSCALNNESDAADLYMEYLFSCAKIKFPKWRVVTDPGNGAQSDIVPKVLKRLGLEVIEINSTIQGEFLARDTEVEEEFSDLKQKVLENGANFGVGYDSDGDRVVFVDENGRFVPGDFTGSLIAIEEGGDSVVTPINTSQVVDHLGKKVIRTKVGSPFVVQAMKENRVDFGFEANGGSIFKEMLSRDGGRTTIELLNILANKGGKLSQLVDSLPRFYLFRSKVEYQWELKGAIMKKVKTQFKGIKLEELDGLKIWLDEDTWILFRSSANAPEFRVFAESRNENKSRKLLAEGMALVKKIVDKND